jgi:hypothetical protein
LTPAVSAFSGVLRGILFLSPSLPNRIVARALAREIRRNGMATRKYGRKRGARGASETRRKGSEPKGPLSLEEARAVVRAQHAATAPRAKEKADVLRQLGDERRQLDRQRRVERRERRRAYEVAYREVAERAIQAPAPPAPPATTTTAALTLPPLRILAEGDSWFDYPVPAFGGSIVPRLATRLGVPIHNLAQAGDEVRYMLGVEQRQRLAEELQRMTNLGTPYDVLLFSGGGNDIVGDPLCLWIKTWDPNFPPAQHVQAARFQAALDLVRAAYEDLVAIRGATSPGTRILLHAYDFAIPDGRKVCFFGPWLKPSFDLRGFPTISDGAGAVVKMLEGFRDTLAALAAAHPNVTLVGTQGTLNGTADWHNELHPSKGGFDAIVEVFRAQLAVLFPGRVPP